MPEDVGKKEKTSVPAIPGDKSLETTNNGKESRRGLNPRQRVLSLAQDLFKQHPDKVAVSFDQTISSLAFQAITALVFDGGEVILGVSIRKTGENVDQSLTLRDERRTERETFYRLDIISGPMAEKYLAKIKKRKVKTKGKPEFEGFYEHIMGFFLETEPGSASHLSDTYAETEISAETAAKLIESRKEVRLPQLRLGFGRQYTLQDLMAEIAKRGKSLAGLLS